MLSFRAAKPRRSPAALQHVLQHVSKYVGCSYASLASRSGSLPPCAHPSGALKLPHAPGSACRIASFQTRIVPSTLCAHLGSIRAGQLSSAFLTYIIEPSAQTTPKPGRLNATAINPPSVRYDTCGLSVFWISGACKFSPFRISGTCRRIKSLCIESQRIAKPDHPKAGCRRNNKTIKKRAGSASCCQTPRAGCGCEIPALTSGRSALCGKRIQYTRRIRHGGAGIHRHRNAQRFGDFLAADA